MKRLLIIVLIFVNQQIVASEPLRSNKLSYEQVIEQKLHYEVQRDLIEQSLAAIDERESAAHAKLIKYHQLINKKKEAANATFLSLDDAYKLLDEYKSDEQERNLSCDGGVRLKQLEHDLNFFQEQVGIIVSQYKNIGISQIIQYYPCNQLFQQIKFNYPVSLRDMLHAYKKTVSQSESLLCSLSMQKQLKIEEQSAVFAALNHINADVATHNRIKALSEQKASQFKNNVADSVMNSVFEQLSVRIDEIEQEKLRKQQMVSVVVNSLIDASALIGEQNVQEKIDAAKIAANAERNKALVAKARQDQRDKEDAIKAKSNQDELLLSEWIRNNQNVLQSKNKEEARFKFMQYLQLQKMSKDALVVEMLRYDAYRRKSDSVSSSEFLLTFKKMLNDSILHNRNNWKIFMQAMYELKADSSMSDLDKSAVNVQITNLFHQLYPIYSSSNPVQIQNEMKQQEKLRSEIQRKIEALRESMQNNDSVVDKAQVESLEAFYVKIDDAYKATIKDQYMFHMMIKLRSLQLIGGAFEQHVPAPVDHRNLLTHKYYETDKHWKLKFEEAKKSLGAAVQKKSCVESSDYQAFLVEQYKKINVPAQDIQLVAFDAAYSIVNMLENKITFNNELDLQKKLFDFLHHKYPSYSLELIADMTKSNFMLFVLMKK